ncbi:uncharacterized protein DUF4012 [Ilumatobacter fluminis]|uniref:Uncharacterized protein DUF4012 n=1 Tax=Ilumatobacter fluminis TaxID=467091 RepID=A0A4R7I495_9ACTN|nr:DUF4012 domain-containing protein [Ilumatobacter fluminis]TDT18492.1 uncharacterized protein DUF4012 [Ilumatobacter fluminis]
MSARKLHVDGRNEQLVLGVGVVTGIGLGLQGLSPTGSTVIDWLLLIASAVFVVWSGATAPWWALAAAAGIAAAIAEPWLPLLVGVGVLGLALAVGTARRSQPVERAIVVGAILLVLSTARDLGAFGVSTAVGVLVAITLAAFGLSRRSRRVRRVGYIAAGAAAGVLVIGTLALVLSGTSARPDLTTGEQAARQGLRELKAADFEQAQSSFERAATSFGRAADDVGAVWTAPARLVPVVSQHHRAVDQLASEAAAASSTVATQLGEIDFDALRIVDGRIDIEAVEGLQQPMAELQESLASLDAAVVSAQDPWLVEPLADRLADLRVDIAEQRDLGDKAVIALDRAPAMLGADGERVYFVMFTTPAEARGQGGFMGNYAEITIDEGEIELTDFGRHSDLNRAATEPFDLSEAPADWLAQYGGEGFARGPGRPVATDVWSIYTISPHFPHTARVADILYPQSGGQDLDGVFNLDVYALEQLVGLVGDVEVDGRDAPLNGTNTAEYLLIEQYETDDNAERIDQLEVIARAVTDRLLGGNAPEPIDLGRAMAPMVRERRLMAWMEDPSEQALLELVSMDGAVLGGRGDRDGVHVAINNDGTGKMDSYLERRMVYEETPDGDELSITIKHTAPVESLPDYVTAVSSDLGRGDGRWLVTVYSTRPVTEAWLDDQPIGVNTGQEAGLQTASIKLVLPPDGSATFRVRFGPNTSFDQTKLIVSPQPLVQPERWAYFGDAPRTLESRSVLDR